VTYLRNRIKNLSGNENVLRDLFSKRIKSLSSETLMIEVGRDLTRKYPNAIAQLDVFFRSYRSLVRFGVFDTRDLKQIKKETKFDKAVGYAISKKSIHTSSSFYYAVKSASSIIRSLSSAGACVLIDE